MLKEASREKPNLAEIPVLHTQIVDEQLLEMLTAGLFQTIELDISSDDNGEHYIGHHWLFYLTKGLAFPPLNVSIEKTMEFIIEHGFFTKLDCKDEEAIPKVVELAQRLGPNRCMLHAFISELNYQTEKGEPHWEYEDIALKKIIELRARAGYPALQVSCRGFTSDGIATLESSHIPNLHEVCDIAGKNEVDIVSLNLPNNQIPPNWVLQYFYDHDILLEVYEDEIKEKRLPCDVFTTIKLE
jgi:hypothetical protein